MNQPASSNSDTPFGSIARATDPGAAKPEQFVPFKVVSAEPLRLVAVDPAGNHYTFDITPEVRAVSYRGQDPTKPQFPIFGFALGFNASPASAEPTSAERIAALKQAADQAENRFTVAVDTIADERREIGAILVSAGLLDAGAIDARGLLGAVQERGAIGWAAGDPGSASALADSKARSERLEAELGAIGYTLASANILMVDDIKRLGVLGAIREKLGLPPMPMRKGADRAPVHVPLVPVGPADTLITDLQSRADASERARAESRNREPIMANPPPPYGPLLLGDETNIEAQHDAAHAQGVESARRSEATIRVLATLDRREVPSDADLAICSTEAAKRAAHAARKRAGAGDPPPMRADHGTHALGIDGKRIDRSTLGGPAGQMLGILLDAEEGRCGTCAVDAAAPTPRDGARLFYVEGPRFTGTVDERDAFWQRAKAAEDQRGMAALEPGESTVYVDASLASDRYAVTRVSPAKREQSDPPAQA